MMRRVVRHDGMAGDFIYHMEERYYIEWKPGHKGTTGRISVECDLREEPLTLWVNGRVVGKAAIRRPINAAGKAMSCS